MATLKLRFLVWVLFFCAIGFCLFAPMSVNVRSHRLEQSDYEDHSDILRLVR